MVKYFAVTISALTILSLIFLSFFIGAIIYAIDGILLTFGHSFLSTFREPLREFLYSSIKPESVLTIIFLIILTILGLLSTNLRPKINENIYTLQHKPVKNKKVTVALTAYNEEPVIGACVKDFIENKYVQEVLVIDNNSVDKTEEVAKRTGAKVIKESQQGYGFACIRGLREALKTGSEIIVLCEGDNTQSGKDIDKFMDYIDHCDMVIGTRTVRLLTEKNTQMSQFYIWGNYFIAFLISLKYFSPIDLTFVRLTDVGCTFRAIRRESLAKIIDKLDSTGHGFSPHMILVAIENNLSVIEIPISFRRREGESKGAGGRKSLGLTVGLAMIWEIITR